MSGRAKLPLGRDRCAQSRQRQVEQRMDHPSTLTKRRSPARPKRSTALIYAARVADIWLHPIAFLRGRRRRPKTFDDLRALGLLAGTPRRPETATGMEGDEQVPEVHETRVPLVH